jgi:hypothetical protein
MPKSLIRALSKSLTMRRLSNFPTLLMVMMASCLYTLVGADPFRPYLD